MDGGDDRDVGRVDREHQADRQKRLDRAGEIHPGSRRIEFGRFKEVKGRWFVELRDYMRDQEQAADKAKNVGAIAEIEVVPVPRHERTTLRRHVKL